MSPRPTCRGRHRDAGASIAAQVLLQSPLVRPKLDNSGEPTGRYSPAPCRMLDGEDAGEASLTKNGCTATCTFNQFEAFRPPTPRRQGLDVHYNAARVGAFARPVGWETTGPKLLTGQ